jgi:hypothetical protein
VNLEELSKATAGLDEATFVNQHPDPALVFFLTPLKAVVSPFNTVSGIKRDKLIRRETPPPPDSETADRVALPLDEDVLAAQAAQVDFPGTATDLAGGGESVHAATGEQIAGNSPVMFVTKSLRNPFADMVTVGRAPNNDLCLPRSSVSKMHAYFRRSSSGWTVTDQKSTNGTVVGDETLERGGTAPLVNGDRVAFGQDMHAKFFLPAGLFGFLELYRSGVVR